MRRSCLAALICAVALFVLLPPPIMAADDAAMKPGEPVNGLKLTVTAVPEVYLIGHDPIGNKIELTFTFRNVGEKPLKAETFALFSRLLAPDIRDPDGKPIEPVYDRSTHRDAFGGPKEKDFPVIQPGKSLTFTSRKLFPKRWCRGIWAIFPGEIPLRKPGPYRVKFIYKATGPPAGHQEEWAAFDEDAWRGEVSSNAFTLHILDGNSQGPQPVDVLLRLLKTGKDAPRAWAAAKLGEEAERGVGMLAGILDESEDPVLRVYAAYGLHTRNYTQGNVQRESKAPPELTKKAEAVFLSSLGNDDESAALARRYYTPTEQGLQWLVDRLRRPDAPKNMKIHGVYILARYGRDRLQADCREICLAALKDDAMEVQQSAAYGLYRLGSRESDFGLYRKLAQHEDPTVRRYAYSLMVGKDNHWAVPQIIEGLRDDDMEVRRKCAYGLMALRYRPAVPALIAMLRDKSHTEGTFPDAYAMACRAVVSLLELDGYDFAKGKDSREDYARLLEWWDREGEKAFREAAEEKKKP